MDVHNIKSIISTTACEYTVSPTLLLKVAQCESGKQLNINAKNPNSSASGLFQFISQTFISEAQAYGLPTTNKNDPIIQTKLAALMIKNGKIGAWSASQHCWNIKLH